MQPKYDDILDRIFEEPTWYDWYGVPRYCKFSPEYCTNTYSCEVALLEIECQACEQRFIVEAVPPRIPGALKPSELLAKGEMPSYGDPPYHGCSEAGETMSAWTIRVVELWRRERSVWSLVDVEQLTREQQTPRQGE